MEEGAQAKAEDARGVAMAIAARPGDVFAAEQEPTTATAAAAEAAAAAAATVEEEEEEEEAEGGAEGKGAPSNSSMSSGICSAPSSSSGKSNPSMLAVRDKQEAPPGFWDLKVAGRRA